MAVVNFAKREIEAKIIFYGPALSGKTTNVKEIHAALEGKRAGKLHILSTEADRTLFFDYAPVLHGEIAGFTARFKLFSVPGQTFYKETRRVLLGGADAIVFVADSSPDRADANVESLKDLAENLASHNLSIETTPLVLQLNKRDLPNAMPASQMLEQLNRLNAPSVEAVAVDRKGVLETLEQITSLAADGVRQRLLGNNSTVSLQALEGDKSASDQEVILEHLSRIQTVRGEEEAEAQRRADAGELDKAEVDAFFRSNVETLGEGDPLESDGERAMAEERARRAELMDLPRGPRVKLGYLHPSQSNMKALRFLSTQPEENGNITLELLMEESGSGERSRCDLVLTPTIQPLPTVKITTASRPPERQKAAPKPPALHLGLLFTAGLGLGFLIWGVLI